MKLRAPGRKRFVAPGRATNYEMRYLRDRRCWRNTRWTYPWRSLADPFHPHSADEWRAHEQAEKEKLDGDD